MSENSSENPFQNFGFQSEETSQNSNQEFGSQNNSE